MVNNYLQIGLLLIVLAVLGVAIYYIRQIFTSEEDAGKVFAKGIMKNRIILLELIGATMNIVEALIAATVAGSAQEEVKSPFGTRLGIHIGISAVGMIGAFTMFTQLKQALESFEIVGYAISRGNITYKKGIGLFFSVFKEVSEALLMILFATLAPTGNVFLIADALGQQEEFWNFDVFNMSNILLSSFFLLFLHQCIYIFVGISTFNFVFQDEMSDEDDAILNYAVDKLGADRDKLAQLFINTDTTSRRVKEVIKHKVLSINTQLGILSSTSASPDDKTKAKAEFDKLTVRTKHYLSEQFK